MIYWNFKIHIIHIKFQILDFHNKLEFEKHFPSNGDFKHLSKCFGKSLVFFITKNKHLHVRVNLDLGMGKEVSGLSHMVSVVRGFLLIVFAFKKPYKYGCNIPLVFPYRVF